MNTVSVNGPVSNHVQGGPFNFMIEFDR